MALFIRGTGKNKPIFLINKSSNILCFNYAFEAMMEGRSIELLDEVLNKDAVVVLERYQKCELNCEDEIYKIKVYHQIINQEEPQNSLYFLEVECEYDDYSQISQGINERVKESNLGSEAAILMRDSKKKPQEK